MQAEIPLSEGLSLKMGVPPAAGVSFATSQLQRGLCLYDGDQELTEEAVGFGVPVIKRGLQTIFPGAAVIESRRLDSTWSIRARFRLSLVERLSHQGNGSVGSPLFYSVKDALAATVRRLPATRAALTAASSGLRRLLDWETTYIDSGFETEIPLIYTVDPRLARITVEIDGRELHGDVTEVVLMHEQGARSFDRYQDTSGANLQGRHIGLWDEVRAAEAWFESSTHRVSFRLGAMPGARLFRGRELIGSRLAWAGFGYSLPPAFGRMQHQITIARLP